ncbi:hypothetical protein TMS3_0102065 [Pseudomonas taeanensis MS-3]|uniref:Calcineurin-like phosphoesterase domain-containing protein n=1 Tax=Pseudomonas taeanensis MS-3 TaxID=1395571 RepID=A0A0A1YNT5_9PSED|nr:hypothetical protein [Pseudomonas taeanensis]KFX70751.1 hypothetical protein TMS3_0102065 [Pseudomonas taeanensis MS-3]
MNLRPGRDCPLDYRLAADAFAGPALFDCDSLYVVGGLYGNRQALVALEGLLAGEPGARAVFNGDAHWFDRDPALFSLIERQLQEHLALRGNVETELGREENTGAGCGCAYPETVSEQTVDWSNAIHRTLSETLQAIPGLAGELAQRPACAVVEVAGQRVAISHGDERSLAGWQCAREALQDSGRRAQLNAWLTEQQVAVLATSHTCVPAALQLPGGVLINNGAAGMPVFAGARHGLVSRIARTPHPLALYRAQHAGLYIEAVPLAYDHVAFLSEFDRQWPAHSPAARAYRLRLLEGPADLLDSALLGGFQRCQPTPVQDVCYS